MDGELRRQEAAPRKRDFNRSELLAQKEASPEGSKQRLIAEKRIELFDAQQDNTGAWKGDYFGRDIRNDLETRGLETGADGLLPSKAEDAQSHLLLINMGELDRLNDQGDHSVGDKALKTTQFNIRSVLEASLQPGQFEIYRTAGNDFSVRLIGVERSVAERLSQQFCRNIDLKGIGQDLAPIVSSLASQSDLIDVLNKLPPNDRAKLLGDEKPESISINMLKELLQQQNDRQKAESRMSRMQSLIDAGDDAAAANFYTKYQRKVLGEMFREPSDKETPDYAAFKTRFLASDSVARHQAAEADARKQYLGRRDATNGIERTMNDVVAAKQKLGVEGFPDNKKGLEVSLSERVSEGFEMPKPTRGKQAVDAKAAKAKELEASGASAEDIELAHLDTELESANRDTLTGLSQRGPMFKQMESAFESGKTTGVIYIDLAFLKYFDKEGNSQTGNVAIQKAAEMLDGIALEASKEGITVEAYRVGGDEFALSVTGGDANAMERIKMLLRDRQLDAPAIPLQGERAIGSFYKQSLSFNYGSHGPVNLEEMRKFVSDNKLPMESKPGSKEELNELADYALRLADKQLEIQKGFNRIGLLIGELNQGQLNGDESHYQQLLKYSSKAIFGKPEKIQELANRDYTPEEVLEYVINSIKAKQTSKEGYQNSIDRVLDERVRELYFEQLMNGLNNQISELKTQLSASKEENQALKDMVKQLEEEVRSKNDLRERIMAS